MISTTLPELIIDSSSSALRLCERMFETAFETGVEPARRPERCGQSGYWTDHCVRQFGQTAAAPLTISEISWVIAAWRALL
jgi:hypothetical protein